MGAAVVVVAAERRLIETFEQAGATSPALARTPDELGVDTSSLSWRRLTKRAVIREVAPATGQYYLDLEVWRAVRRSRMRLVIVLIVILLGIWLYVATVGIVHSASRMGHPRPDSAVPSAGRT